MVRAFIFGMMLILLSACGMFPGAPLNPATPIPTFTPAISATVDPRATQVAALGGKQSGDLFVWIYSSPNPPVRGSNTFEAFVTDASGQPITDAKLSFDIDMTNMSHGRNVVQAAPAGSGRYNGKLSFMMPGPWRVNVGIERAGTATTVRFDFNVSSR